IGMTGARLAARGGLPSALYQIPHTAPAAAVIALGAPPTWIVPTTRSDELSIRITVPSSGSATQTLPGPTAIPEGLPPTLIVGRAPMAGLMPITVPESLLVTHTIPRSTATSLGEEMSRVWVTL